VISTSPCLFLKSFGVISQIHHPYEVNLSANALSLAPQL